MARVPVHTIEDAPPASAILLQSITHTSPTGRPLNMQAQMAEAPAVLSGYVGLRRAVEENGTLDPRQRAALMAAAAATFGVPYVEAITSMLAGRAGWTTEEVGRLRTSGTGGAQMDALLEVVRAACRNLGEVSEDTWNAALAQGWTTGQLTECLAYVAIVLYSAYFVNFAGTAPDLPAMAGLGSS